MLKAFKRFRIGGVEFDTELTVVIALSVLLPMFYHYHHNIFDAYYPSSSLEAVCLRQLLFYFVVPVLTVVLVFWKSPTKYGLAIGKWREGLLWTFGACVGMGIILWFVAKRPEMGMLYKRRDQETVLRIIGLSGVEMFSWEYIWRGFCLFAMARVLGPGPAIFLQAVPFAFLHIGKPEFETLTTIFGGAGFGFVAWRTQSFLYSFLIHWFMLSFIILAAAGKLG